MLLRGLSAAFSTALVLSFLVAVVISHPKTSLPPEWNPFAPLKIAHGVTPMTAWKLGRTASDDRLCMAALAAERVDALPPLVEEERCGIDPRVRVVQVGKARVPPVETTCAVALRLAMWERHGLQPAARRILGADITELRHFSSYSCRLIRTMAGDGGRLSTHATAEAIDISGFGTSTGESIDLLADWEAVGPRSLFLRAARDSACDWFETTLGPDYNALHRDHFHLQSRGWGLCR